MIAPDSPFAHLGTGSVDDRRIGMKQLVTMHCTGCGREWDAPDGVTTQNACPYCRSPKTQKVEGTARLSGRPRV